MNITHPRKVFYGLTGIIFILLILNIASYLNLFLNDLTPRDYFYRKTNFNTERNLPTIFSSCLHFIAAILLGYTALSNLKIQSKKSFWWIMSIALLFIGLDELLVIHEKVGKAISGSYETSGLFFYSWIIPYLTGTLILALLILKPLLQLPKKTSRDFIISGCIFVLGAVGIEMLTGFYIDNSNLNHNRLDVIPEIFILYTIEELLEMTGVAFFIFALLRFLKLYKKPINRKHALSFSK